MPEFKLTLLEGLFIAVDFDGTCVMHEYPNVGADVPGAVEVLKKIAARHNIILYTMRHDEGLIAAVEWFKARGIPLYSVNNNPTQASWTSSPKVYANFYIDDAAIGCPIIFDIRTCDRRYVDWMAVESTMQEMNLLP